MRSPNSQGAWYVKPLLLATLGIMSTACLGENDTTATTTAGEEIPATTATTNTLTSVAETVTSIPAFRTFDPIGAPLLLGPDVFGNNAFNQARYDPSGRLVMELYTVEADGTVVNDQIIQTYTCLGGVLKIVDVSGSEIDAPEYFRGADVCQNGVVDFPEAAGVEQFTQ